jgi:hypothetical protein
MTVAREIDQHGDRELKPSKIFLRVFHESSRKRTKRKDVDKISLDRRIKGKKQTTTKYDRCFPKRRIIVLPFRRSGFLYGLAVAGVNLL